MSDRRYPGQPETIKLTQDGRQYMQSRETERELCSASVYIVEISKGTAGAVKRVHKVRVKARAYKDPDGDVNRRGNNI